MAQRRQDPTLDDQHTPFHLGLVAGLTGARGDDGDPIMGSHILVSWIEVRLVPVSLGNARFQIVGDH